MADKNPVVFDDDNPEWTKEHFVNARPAGEVLPAEFLAAFKRQPGRPRGTTTSNKAQVTLRLDRDVIEKFKAGGPGWQSRINEVLRSASLHVKGA